MNQKPRDIASSLAERQRRKQILVAFVRLLHSLGGTFEIRALGCRRFPGSDSRGTATCYFDDAEAAAAQAIGLDVTLDPAGIYITLNPPLPDLRARSNGRFQFSRETTNDSQICCRRWLLLDLDPVRPPGISSTDGELAASAALAHRIEAELSAEGWPSPLRVMSGNGHHLLYRIDLPNDAESTALIRSVLHGLADRFDTEQVKIDRSTFNASRIVKLPGTTARKGCDFVGDATTPARPHRIATWEAR